MTRGRSRVGASFVSLQPEKNKRLQVRCRFVARFSILVLLVVGEIDSRWNDETFIVSDGLRNGGRGLIMLTPPDWPFGVLVI